MELVIVFILGIVLGGILGFIIRNSVSDRPAGTIRMDHSDPSSPPYLFLELEPGAMEELQKRTTVVFKVKLQDYISQK